MRNIVILNSLHFSYPLPILMRVSYNTLIVKQNTSDYYKYADIQLKQKEIEDAIAIPSEAIVPEMGKNKVFVYRSGVADPVDVIIGLRTEAEVQIVRGLSVGDTILTSGTLQLRKGMPVELQAIN